MLNEMKKVFSQDDDFFLLQRYFHGTSIIFAGLNSLIDVPKTMNVIEDKLLNEKMENHHLSVMLDEIGERKEEVEDAVTSILEGKLLLFISDKDFPYFISVEPLANPLNRSLEQPNSESILQGPLNAFNEDIKINLGIVRKKVVSQNLKLKNYTAGKKQKKNITLIFDEENVDNKLLESVLKIIDQNKEKPIHTIQDLNLMLGISKWSFVSRIHATEQPQEMAAAISRGKVVLFIDGYPLAYILPSTLWDTIMLEHDKNLPVVLMYSLRSIRIIGLIIALIAPALYVALVAVNPEILRIELALSIAQSREGVPYPALVEMILMLIVLELIMEASVRLPKSIGPTITMVGGIILGQAVVDAKLVSNLLIIILAATTIANATVVGFQNLLSIRLLKYVVLFLAAIFGVLGILTGLFFVCAYFASITTLGVPYLNFKNSKGENTDG